VGIENGFEPSAVPIDSWLHQFFAGSYQLLKGSGFISTHEARVADHVSGQYGSKAAFHGLLLFGRRLSIMDERIYADENAPE
jgi:hypothetical protein